MASSESSIMNQFLRCDWPPKRAGKDGAMILAFGTTRCDWSAKIMFLIPCIDPDIKTQKGSWPIFSALDLALSR